LVFVIGTKHVNLHIKNIFNKISCLL